MRHSHSEHAANSALASTVIATQARAMAIESERADWRAVLADRDSGKARRRAANRAQAGRATVGTLQALAIVCAAIVARFGGV